MSEEAKARKEALLIVDDHPLFRKGVVQLIEEADDFEVVGEASSGEEGIALALRLQPDVVLLDVNMRDMSGIEVLDALKDADSDARVIMLTMS